MMACVECGSDLDVCSCPDIDERLRNLSDTQLIALKWCFECDKHYARCRCAEPLFGIRTGGRILPVADWDKHGA